MEQQQGKSEFNVDNIHVAMPPYDIFQSEADGSVLWRGSAATLDEAKSRIQELTASVPGQYIILSRLNGSKVVVGNSDNAA
jgi:hypothetical protein